MKYKHAPFEESCSNCHQSHSAKETNLLSDKSPNLCYNCHESFDSKTWLVESASSILSVCSENDWDWGYSTIPTIVQKNILSTWLMEKKLLKINSIQDLKRNIQFKDYINWLYLYNIKVLSSRPAYNL